MHWMVARLLRANPKIRILSRRIRRQELVLRRELSDAAWSRYLTLEALINERQAEVLEVLCSTGYIRGTF